jgi:glycosyltransferase involved in cell wall biosynthesis
MEITVVNDRSTDRTGEILGRMAREDPRLRVVYVSELPSGWLGKNYAMQSAAERATGQWLLFTDADVLFEPSLLKRTIGYAQQQQVDHLAMLPQPQMPTWLLETFVVMFGLCFCTMTRLWNVGNPRSKAFVGVGAFNLVRAEAYRQIGGHRPVAMRPDDDLKLGKVLKFSGCRQGVLFGVDMLRVPWYGSLRELVVGLEKNCFAGLDYSLPATILSTGSMLAFAVWPFLAPLFTSGTTRWLYIAVVLILWLLAWDSAAQLKARWSCAFGLPLATALFVFIIWRATLLTLKRGGIRWRDTHYPLAELRANRV